MQLLINLISIHGKYIDYMIPTDLHWVRKSQMIQYHSGLSFLDTDHHYQSMLTLALQLMSVPYSGLFMWHFNFMAFVV